MRPLAALALLLALALPLVVASGLAPPQGATSLALGAPSGDPGRVVWWVGSGFTGGNASVQGTVAPGTDATLWIGLRPDDIAANSTRTYFVNLTSSDVDFANATLTQTLPLSEPRTTELYDYLNTTLHVPANATGTVSFTLNGTAVEPGANNTTVVLGPETSVGHLLVNVVVPAPPPPATGLPRWAYYAGGAAIVVLAGAIVVSARQRNVQRRMRGDTRSQALREAELEELAEKKPERAAEIKQEIRAQEVAREKRREVQILEAKKADVLKGMDLLKKRHELGALSKLQYDNMLAKRQTELSKIEAELAQMDAEDAGSGAAA